MSNVTTTPVGARPSPLPLVNNASMGVYAKIVESADYWDAKMQIIAKPTVVALWRTVLDRPAVCT